jgi:hypothetical protein
MKRDKNMRLKNRRVCLSHRGVVFFSVCERYKKVKLSRSFDWVKGEQILTGKNGQWGGQAEEDQCQLSPNIKKHFRLDGDYIKKGFF